jgi:hypothetical protein
VKQLAEIHPAEFAGESGRVEAVSGYNAAVTYEYVNSLEYTNSNTGAMLAGFHAQVAPTGRRGALDILPTGEHFDYGYDATNLYLTSEARTLNGVRTATGYGYDGVGNRTSRTTVKADGTSQTETFNLDNDYQLRSEILSNVVDGELEIMRRFP